MCDRCERAADELVEVATAQMEELPDLGNCASTLLVWAALRAAKQEGQSVSLARLMLRLGGAALANAAGPTPTRH